MISSKTYYGISALVYLAVSHQDNCVGIKEIAEKQKIPGRFLESVMARLRSRGLAKSLRGAAGGYMLSKPPDQIQLSEIISACEGSVGFNIPPVVQERASQGDPLARALSRLLEEQSSILDRNLKSLTLSDIVHATGLTEEMYWI